MIVVDASVWISRLVAQDVHHHVSRRWLEMYDQQGGLIVAPLLLLIEMAGALSRRTGDPTFGRRAVATLLRLPSLRVVRLDRPLGLTCAALAADCGLRGADATYVGVAHSLNIPLLTWDEDQRDRASAVVAAHTPDALDPRAARVGR